MKCQVSALYGKDDNNNITFHCQFCNKEMDYDEKRECTATPDKCKCGYLLGDMDYSVSTCLNCKRKI